MYYPGPFVLLNEKNGHHFEIDCLYIGTDFNCTCEIVFKIHKKHNNNKELNIMFYKDAIYESIIFAKNILADYRLYELVKIKNKNIYKRILTLELKNGLITNWDEDNNTCTVRFDYFIPNSESKIFNNIYKEQQLYQQLNQHNIEEQYSILQFTNFCRNDKENEIEQLENELYEIQNSWKKFTPWGFYKLWINNKI